MIDSRQNGRRPNRGFTLLEMMVALAIAAVAVVAMQGPMGHLANGVNSMFLDRDRAQILSMLMKRVDCEQTLKAYTPASTCPANIPLLDRSGNIIVNGSDIGSLIGSGRVRATCGTSGIHAQWAVFAKNSVTQFKADPQTGTMLNWTSPRAELFPPGAELCRSSFTTAAAGPPGLLFGGYLYRCPYDSDGAAWVVNTPFEASRPVPGMPLNIYSGTTDCPAGYVPRAVWGYTAAACPSQIYCACGWSKSNHAKAACGAADAVGCGEYQYMCLKSTDGSPVPGTTATP